MTRSGIRRAESEDLEAVSACARAAYARYVSRIGREPAPMVADFASAIRAGEVFVMVEDGPPLGFIVLRPAPDYLFVENVAVHPDAQGRGLGYRPSPRRRRGAADCRRSVSTPTSR